MAQEVNELPGPYEIFELTDGQTAQIRITGWQQGNVTIHPAHQPAGKLINALRVQVTKETKSTFPPYWDITSQRLQAQIVPYLEQSGYQDKVFTVTKHGVAPKARFTLEVRPA